MDTSGYVILVLLGVEALTLLGAGIWIAVLTGRARGRLVEICELKREIRRLDGEMDAQADKERLEELDDAAALDDFNRRDAGPLVPGDAEG